MSLLEFVETSELNNSTSGGTTGTVAIEVQFEDRLTTLPGDVDEERPPRCPTCARRLVILATHPWRDERGAAVRRQLWGCPFGHATAYRMHGAFGPLEIYQEREDTEC